MGNTKTSRTGVVVLTSLLLAVSCATAVYTADYLWLIAGGGVAIVCASLVVFLPALTEAEAADDAMMFGDWGDRRQRRAMIRAFVPMVPHLWAFNVLAIGDDLPGLRLRLPEGPAGDAIVFAVFLGGGLLAAREAWAGIKNDPYLRAMAARAMAKGGFVFAVGVLAYEGARAAFGLPAPHLTAFYLAFFSAFLASYDWRGKLAG